MRGGEMRKPRDIDQLLSLIKKLSVSESMKIDYILSNLNKVSNLHNLRLSEEEKRLLKKYQNKNFGNLKNDPRSAMKPKFDM